MPNYRRAWHPGGTYFFTVNLLERSGNDLLVKHIEELRTAIRAVMHSHPFTIHAWVVLPDHFHCIVELPQDDSDFATRMRLIKTRFSKLIALNENRSAVRVRRAERGIWQRRFWEHLIRDDKDFAAHMDYVHINPLKHGLVKHVGDWPYSTFHRLVEADVYPYDWAGGFDVDLGYEDLPMRRITPSTNDALRVRVLALLVRVTALIIGAMMQKLIHVAFGVLKSGKKFDPTPHLG